MNETTDIWTKSVSSYQDAIIACAKAPIAASAMGFYFWRLSAAGPVLSLTGGASKGAVKSAPKRAATKRKPVVAKAKAVSKPKAKGADVPFVSVKTRAKTAKKPVTPAKGAAKPTPAAEPEAVAKPTPVMSAKATPAKPADPVPVKAPAAAKKVAPVKAVKASAKKTAATPVTAKPKSVEAAEKAAAKPATKVVAKAAPAAVDKRKTVSLAPEPVAGNSAKTATPAKPRAPRSKAKAKTAPQTPV